MTRPPVFLFNSTPERAAVFEPAFAADMPDIVFAANTADIDPDDVRYLITWTLPPDLARYRNLEVVFSIGAGVDQFERCAVSGGGAWYSESLRVCATNIVISAEMG